MRVDNRPVSQDPFKPSPQSPAQTPAKPTAQPASQPKPAAGDSLQQDDLIKQHPSIGAKRAELLEKVGVTTLRELSRRNAGNLAETLNTTNKTAQLTKETYSAATVQKWIDEAKQMLAKEIPATLPNAPSTPASDPFKPKPNAGGTSTPASGSTTGTDPFKPKPTPSTGSSAGVDPFKPQPGQQTGGGAATDPFKPKPGQQTGQTGSVGVDPFKPQPGQQTGGAHAADPFNPGGQPPQVPVETEADRQRDAVSTLDSRRLHELGADDSPSVRQAVAANRYTPPATLERLAQDPYPEIRAHVALNPGTSTYTLVQLASDREQNVRETVLKRGDLPREALQKLAYDPQAGIRMKLAARDRLPSEILDTLSSDAHTGVRRTLVQRPDLNPGQLMTLARDPDETVQQGVLRHPQTNNNVLNELVRHPNPGLRSGIAAHGKAGPELLTAMSRDENSNVRAAVARNQNSPAQALNQLLRDPEPAIRLAVAEHPAAGPDLYSRMLKDPDANVRKTIANRTSSEAQLSELATDDNSDVRRTVAVRTRSSEILETLAGDKEPSIRRLVASNAGVTSGILSTLGRDKDVSIRAAVAGHGKADEASLMALARDPETSVKLAVLGNARLNDNLREAVMSSGLNQDIMLSLAGDTRTPAATLEQLAPQAGADSVRQRLLYHPQATPKVVETVMSQPLGQSLQLTIAGNAQSPVRALEMLTARADNDGVKQGLILNPRLPGAQLDSLLEKGLGAEARLQLAGNRATPVKALERFASQADGEALRLALVRHPSANARIIDTVLAQPISAAGKQALAEDARMPAQALELLSTDKASHKQLARNPNTPAKALQRIAASKDTDVQSRFLTMFHAKADASVADALAASPNWELRYAAAKSDKATAPVVAKLKKDSNSFVADRANDKKPFFGTGWVANGKLEKALKAAGVDVDDLEARKIDFKLTDD